MVVMGGIAVAGTAGRVSVLDCAKEIHCSYCSLLFGLEPIGMVVRSTYCWSNTHCGSHLELLDTRER